MSRQPANPGPPHQAARGSRRWSARGTPWADSAETRERLLVSITEFQAVWQQAWREGELYRRRTKRLQQQLRPRLPFLHCHNDGRDFGALDGRVGLTKFENDSLVVHDFLLMEMAVMRWPR